MALFHNDSERDITEKSTLAGYLNIIALGSLKLQLPLRPSYL